MAPRIEPQPGPQTRFLRSNADIVIYGGAAGGGKTYALLLDPLYHVNNPRFGAVIFRRTTKQVRNEGGLWDTAGDIYPLLGAKPNQAELTYTFGGQVTIGFAHLEHEKNKFDWQGAQIPWIGFDELTHFSWGQFTYLLSRNRSMSGIPGRIRATCNPDPDHWVRRFMDWWIGDDGLPIPERAGVVRHFIVVNDEVVWGDSREALVADYPKALPKSFTFIPASIEDNRLLLETDPSYLSNLHALPRVEREQLLGGNWDVRPAAGMYFQRSWFEVVDAAPRDVETVRAWDLAGTADRKATERRGEKGPAWTAGVKLSRCRKSGTLYVEHVERFRAAPAGVKRGVTNTAEQDSTRVKIRLNQDPGQAGKDQAQNYVQALAAFTVRVRPETGSKEERAGPVSSQAEAGNIRLVRGQWNEAFLAELEAFPDGAFKDQVDALSAAYHELCVHSQAGVLF